MFCSVREILTNTVEYMRGVPVKQFTGLLRKVTRVQTPLFQAYKTNIPNMNNGKQINYIENNFQPVGHLHLG